MERVVSASVKAAASTVMPQQSHADPNNCRQRLVRSPISRSPLKISSASDRTVSATFHASPNSVWTQTGGLSGLISGIGCCQGHNEGTSLLALRSMTPTARDSPSVCLAQDGRGAWLAHALEDHAHVQTVGKKASR